LKSRLSKKFTINNWSVCFPTEIPHGCFQTEPLLSGMTSGQKQLGIVFKLRDCVRKYFEG